MKDDLHLIAVNVLRTFHIFTVLSAVAIFNIFEGVSKALQENLEYTEEDIKKGD